MEDWVVMSQILSMDVAENKGEVEMSQIRMASSSILTNIAEGWRREGGQDFASFLQIAMGSATEVVYLILLCKDIQLLSPQIYEDLQI